jgi:hypothetical protein
MTTELFTLTVGCTSTMKLETAKDFNSTKTIEQWSNKEKAYQMAPPTSDRSYCDIIKTSLVDVKLNDTLTPNAAKLNRQCKTVKCFDVDVFSTN